MTGTNRGTVTILLAIGALILAGCTLPSAPTPTTALPTQPPTEMAEATVTPVPTQTPVPTASPLPTSTPAPTATAAATATSLPPSPAPTAITTTTALPQPTRSRPRPTASPEFTGKLVFRASVGGDLHVIDAASTGAGGRDQRPMFKGALDGLTLEYAGLGDRAISWTQ